MTDAVTGKSFMSRLSGMSLARRITLAALVWGLLVLVGGAIALSTLYNAQTLRIMEDNLSQRLTMLNVDIQTQDAILPNGQITDTDRTFLASDSRFGVPLSGEYWAIVAVDDAGTIGGHLGSKSLWDADLPLSQKLADEALAAPGEIRFGHSDVIEGQSLHVGVMAIRLESRGRPLLLMTASDRSVSDAAVRSFRNLLLGTMLALFGGVFAAMVAGIRISLRPLKALEQDVAEIREGNVAKLDGDYPAEVRDLADELNKLIDHNQSVVERARMHVGNLAHALKTPLAVLRNEADGKSQLDDVVRRQTESMQTNVDHYLKRARMAARAETLGARTDVRPVVDGLARMFNRLHDARGIEVTVRGSESAVFRGEKQDLEEMLGNLMDNACKWATSAVRVTLSDGPEGLLIEVEDDGKGLTPDERAGALQRGVRLDETTPGTGLGLSIVTELAELYKGSFELDEATLGGLMARLRFPRP